MNSINNFFFGGGELALVSAPPRFWWIFVFSWSWVAIVTGFNRLLILIFLCYYYISVQLTHGNMGTRGHYEGKMRPFAIYPLNFLRLDYFQPHMTQIIPWVSFDS